MSQRVQRILIVDDEKGIVSSLRRLFLDEEYELFSAFGGAEGLEVLRKNEVDLVISDVRMPGMDGIAFLREVMRLYPRVIRILLSGYADSGVLTAALSEGIALQFVSKPWDDGVIKSIVLKALQKADVQKRKHIGLQRIINSLSSLPVLPDTYTEIKERLGGVRKSSMDDVAGIIEKDISLAAELMRWANSAVFGQMHSVETVKRALVVLGGDLVLGVVFARSVFNSFPPRPDAGNLFDRDLFRLHSVGTAFLAGRLLARRSAGDAKDVDRAFTAGLLHDIGKLVEAAYFPTEFKAILSMAESREIPVSDAELEVLGTTHEEIGGHLADWWSMPPFLVHAIRRHHDPNFSVGDREIVAAVSVADVLAHRFGIGCCGNVSPPPMDESARRRFDLSEESLAALKTEAAAAVS